MQHSSINYAVGINLNMPGGGFTLMAYVLTYLTHPRSKAVFDRRVLQSTPQGQRPCGSINCVTSGI